MRKFAISLGLTAAALVCLNAPVAVAPSRDVVLMLPAGGFLSASESKMQVAAEEFRKAGLKPVFFQYPIDRPIAAWRATKRAARNFDARYVYGESAGGVLAGLLASRGLVDRGVVNSTLADLTGSRWDPWLGYWLQLSDRQRRFLSPGLRPSASPVLALSSRDEEWVPFTRTCVRWAQRDPLVHHGWIGEGHITGPSPRSYRTVLARASRFLENRLQRPQ